LNSTGGAEITVYELPAQGPCRNLTSFPLRSVPLAFVHDFIATTKHLVFFVPPIYLNKKKLPGLLAGATAPSEALEWWQDKGTEVIVVPIDDVNNITRFITDSFFAVHFSNAYETAEGEIVVDYTHSDDEHIYRALGNLHKNLPNNVSFKQLRGKSGSETSLLKRAVINPEKKTIRQQTLFDSLCEFPKIHPSLQGSKHRFTYFVSVADDGEEDDHVFFTDVCKLDGETAAVESYQLGNEQFPLEPVFVRRTGGKAEDDGYLLSMVYDAINDSSYLAVFDAKKVAQGPVAKLHFDMPLPVSFHGIWVAA
jgi:all-trans-8'-apo-beta-carotenal 15,15'-oxygenase